MEFRLSATKAKYFAPCKKSRNLWFLKKVRGCLYESKKFGVFWVYICVIESV